MSSQHGSWIGIPVSFMPTRIYSVLGRRHLRSAESGQLDYPRIRLITYGGRAFAYAGPST